MKKNGFVKPPRMGVHFDAEQGKIFRYYPTAVEVVRLKNPYPAYFVKTEKNPEWRCKTTESDLPFLLYEPFLDDLEPTELQIKYHEKNLKVYNDILDYIGRDRVKLTTQYRHRHWFIYCLLMQCGEYAADIVRSNPALGFLLSAHAVYHPLASKKYWRSISSLILKKRKDVLGYFGFPAREAVVGLIKKIQPEMCTISLFFWLRKRLKEKPELLRRFGFVQTLNFDVILFLLSQYSDLCSDRFIREVSEQKDDDDFIYYYYLIQEIMRIKKTLENNGVDVPNIHFTNTKNLSSIHDELSSKLEFLELDDDIEYDECPIKDIRNPQVEIEVIKNARTLHLESREMHHCIFSYHEDIKAGNHWAAKMFKPQRLTVLFRETSDALRIVDIRGAGNCLPDQHSVDLIEKWIAGRKFFDERYQLTFFDILDKAAVADVKMPNAHTG